MSVLHDLLVIVKQKQLQYMVLDPVQAEAPEQKTYIQFLARKKVGHLIFLCYVSLGVRKKENYLHISCMS